MKGKVLVGEVVKYFEEIEMKTDQESSYENPDIVTVKLDNDREIRVYKEGIVEILSETDSKPVTVKFIPTDVIL